MIPKIIHYCWFGRGEMPELALKCIESWHKYMPDWEYRLWNEENFDVNCIPYTREAYSAGKYAFVSDYVRLWALAKFGGLYLDTDVEVFKSFYDIMGHTAFVGFEGSKYCPIGTCVMASVPQGEWVNEFMGYYHDRHFIKVDGSFDLTSNVTYITKAMEKQGLVCDGLEQDFGKIHVFPVEYFSPRRTTGEYIQTDDTYSNHLGLNSWSGKSSGWKATVLKVIGRKNMVKLIKLKRKILG